MTSSTALVGAVDTRGVTILVGDTVRVTSYGAPVRQSDCGRTAKVAGFTRAGNVVLRGWAHDPADDIARGRAVSPGMLAVLRRDGVDGLEGNR